jgi:hypothetical protein|tara:strand:- start:184 stop:654 length:471 start_codon:yes stop_codon:yes gene_type:complete
MRNTIFFLIIHILALTSSAEVKTYGNGVSDQAQPIRISELNANPGSYVDRRVKVIGLVDDICPMMGCWVDILEKQSSKTIRLKVQDGVIVFPAEARGEKIVAEGTLREYILSKDQTISWLKHEAVERGLPYDESLDPEPMTFYQIEGTGAVVGQLN